MNFNYQSKDLKKFIFFFTTVTVGFIFNFALIYFANLHLSNISFGTFYLSLTLLNITIFAFQPFSFLVIRKVADERNLKNSALTARSLGFTGKFCIHPAQIEPVNTAFTPSAEEIALAQKQVTAFKEAESQGSSSIQVDGHFIDYPIAERAQRTLTLIAAIEAKKNS